MARLKDSEVYGSLVVTDSVVIGDNEINVEEKLEEISVDYIVETKIGSNYIYKKYNSGLMEIWMTTSVTTAISNAWGNGYINPSPLTYPDFPVAFTSTPYVELMCLGDGTNGAWVMYHSIPTTTSPSKYYLVRTATMESKTLKVQCHAIGRWK